MWCNVMSITSCSGMYDMIWFDMIWFDMIWYDSWYDSCAHNEVQSKHFGTCLTMPQPWQCVDPALSPVDGHGDLHRYDWHTEVSYNRGAQSSKFFAIINGKTNGLGYAYFRYFRKAHMNPSLLWGVTKNYKKLCQKTGNRPIHEILHVALCLQLEVLKSLPAFL